jgi:SurA N-terminal domain
VKKDEGKRQKTKRWCRLASALAALFVVATLNAQIIDRVLAVVASQPITLSDVRAALALGLVPPADTGEKPERAALNNLIDRQLQLIEVNRYLPPEPTPAEVDAKVSEIRARFNGDAAFQAALTENGFTPDQLRARVRDNLRIESYLFQRFGVGPEPSEEELQRFYRSSDFTRDGTERPYSEVREEVKRRLVEARKASRIRDWLAGLRRRVEVAVLPM